MLKRNHIFKVALAFFMIAAFALSFLGTNISVEAAPLPRTVLENAINDLSDGATHTLQDDITGITNGISITTDKNITLDLAGYTLSGSCTIIHHSGTGTLTITDSVGGGKISSDVSRSSTLIIEARASLNLENITVESTDDTSQTIFTSDSTLYSGNLNISNCIILSAALDYPTISIGSHTTNIINSTIFSPHGYCITCNENLTIKNSKLLNDDDPTNDIKTLITMYNDQGTLTLIGSSTRYANNVSGDIGEIILIPLNDSYQPLTKTPKAEVVYNPETKTYDVEVSKIYDAIYSLDGINWTHKNKFSFNADNTEYKILVKMSEAYDFLAQEVVVKTGNEIGAQTKDETNLSLSSNCGEVSFDETATKHIRSFGKIEDLRFEVAKCDDYDKENFLTYYQRQTIGDNQFFKIALATIGSPIADFAGGTATVTLNKNLDFDINENSMVYYVAPNGDVEYVPCDLNGDMTFSTSHFSYYMITDEEIVFGDVSTGAGMEENYEIL